MPEVNHSTDEYVATPPSAFESSERPLIPQPRENVYGSMTQVGNSPLLLHSVEASTSSGNTEQRFINAVSHVDSGNQPHVIPSLLSINVPAPSFANAFFAANRGLNANPSPRHLIPQLRENICGGMAPLGNFPIWFHSADASTSSGNAEQCFNNAVAHVDSGNSPNDIPSLLSINVPAPTGFDNGSSQGNRGGMCEQSVAPPLGLSGTATQNEQQRVCDEGAASGFQSKPASSQDNPMENIFNNLSREQFLALNVAVNRLLSNEQHVPAGHLGGNISPLDDGCSSAVPQQNRLATMNHHVATPAWWESEDYPTITLKKISDYQHVHQPTQEELLSEFRVFKTIDYRHKTSSKLTEDIKDIDIDKIVEKRKRVAQRRKELEYLKQAERPEDTVSNPQYPKNSQWQPVYFCDKENVYKAMPEERLKPARPRKKRKALEDRNLSDKTREEREARAHLPPPETFAMRSKKHKLIMNDGQLNPKTQAGFAEWLSRNPEYLRLLAEELNARNIGDGVNTNDYEDISSDESLLNGE